MPKPAVARLTTPAQMVASLPLYLGYTPSESLVVACLHEPRGRLGLTLRIDLPKQDQLWPFVDEMVQRIRQEEPSRLLLVVFTEDKGDHPHAALVAELVAELEDELDVTDALRVTKGRFWSYLCSNTSCCPAEGTPVDHGSDDDQVRLVQAESVLRGQVVLPDREALAASLAGPTFLAATQARQRCEQAWSVLDPERSLQAWTAAVQRFAEPPAQLEPDEAALLAVSLRDVLLRDELAATFEPERLRPLLAALCRATPAPYDAPVCTLYAWMTYCDGAGAEVTIALERALTSDPNYSLALLLLELLHRQTRPAELRRITRQAARELPAARRRAQR